MCGIIGTTKVLERGVGYALDSLAHRGPDQRGTFADEHLALGHCRLSIIDLSGAGKQPMEDATGASTITYNGEVYNYRELKAALEAAGARFKTETDTEVILEGYAREGASFFNKLRGMWALAIYDKQKGQVILSRDQFGIKPLYYSMSDNRLSFASEMKAFTHLGISLEPNTEEFYTFFNLGYFFAPATCYKDIYMLEPGEILSYNLSTKSFTTSWLARPERSGEESPLGETDVVDRLRETLLDSVRAHYVADVPVGILFSGGNDSALLAALSREAGYSPRAYHLAVEGSSDTEYARQIARELNLQSDFIEMGAQELISQYEEVWKFLDVPFADISIIPTSLIYKKIAGRSKVVLSGEGGDEWFGGYLRHQRLAGSTQMSVKGGLLSVVDKLYGTSTSALTISNPLLRRVRNAYLALHDDVIGTYMAETKLIDYPLASSRLRTALYNAQATGESGPANLFFDRHLYLPNDLLMKTDLASMASSVEARVPFVDREVAARVREIPEFLQLSPRYRDKYLLKKILERYLPHHLIYRDKRGFGFSFERYHVPQFGEDVHKAIAFHHVHADTFGLVEERSLLQEAHADILIKKYPRFAFGLVSNWKLFA